MTRAAVTHNITRALFACLVVLIAIESANAQANTLQGKVALPNGMAPPTSVRVTLIFSGRRVHEAFTDLSGRFSFSGLAKGNYQLVADGDGETFETTTVSAEVISFGSAPQVFTQNIPLRPVLRKGVPAAGVVSAHAVDANAPPRAREEYEKGLKQARDNKFEKAVGHFQAAIAAHPRYYSAHVALAEQYTKLKRDEEAAEAYQKAIELKPEGAHAYVGLGLMLAKQQRYAEAIPPLRRSLELDKQSSIPYLFLGLAEMMTGDLQNAEVNLVRAYEIGKPALANLYLANLYDLKGEPAKAIEHLKRFLDANPNMPEARRADIQNAIDKLRKQMTRKP